MLNKNGIVEFQWDGPKTEDKWNEARSKEKQMKKRKMKWEKCHIIEKDNKKKNIYIYMESIYEVEKWRWHQTKPKTKWSNREMAPTWETRLMKSRIESEWKYCHIVDVVYIWVSQCHFTSNAPNRDVEVIFFLCVCTAHHFQWSLQVRFGLFSSFGPSQSIFGLWPLNWVQILVGLMCQLRSFSHSIWFFFSLFLSHTVILFRSFCTEYEQYTGFYIWNDIWLY